MRRILTLLLLATLILTITSCSKKNTKEVVGTVVFTNGETTFEVDAILQQVIVIFVDHINQELALKWIEKCGGEVINEIPAVQYYLVHTKKGKENDFIQKIQCSGIVEFAYPDALSQNMSTRTIVVDDYNEMHPIHKKTHGQLVSEIIQGCAGNNKNVKDIDIGENLALSKAFPLIDSLFNSSNEPLVFNFSFGPYINSNKKKDKWSEADFLSRDSFKDRYFYHIKNLISFFGKYDKHDFVVVRIAGNQGVPEFEENVINRVYGKLNKKQRKIFDRHFIIVSAQDSRNPKYSNMLTPGVHHPWVTKVDISDLFGIYNDTLTGTSFASPRAACFISSLADKYNLQVTKVLQFARLATKNNPDHLLTFEELEKTILLSRMTNNRYYEFYSVQQIPYNQELFESGSSNYFYLPNGDCIHYRYEYSVDFFPYYAIIFTMNGDYNFIHEKYNIILTQSFTTDTCFKGSGERDFLSGESHITVMISLIDYHEIPENELYVIVSRKKEQSL